MMAAAALLLAACTEDDGQRIDRLTTQTTNPPVYIYIEDVEGRDLVAAGEPVSITLPATGEALDYRIVTPTEAPLPWGGHGALLEVFPAAPYHHPLDNDYVYTLDPTIDINVGDAYSIKLQRVFDYDLRRHDMGSKGQTVDVSYIPAATLLQGTELKSDTAHIIIEDRSPSLRVDGDELTMEMLFPLTGDSLALPLAQVAEREWSNGQLNLRLLYSGRVIARPDAHVSTTVADSTLSMQVKLRLPYIYEQGNDYHYFSYDYIVSCPAVFGKDYGRSVGVELFDWGGRGVSLQSLTIGFRRVEPEFTAPNYILIDWRDILNQ